MSNAFKPPVIRDKSNAVIAVLQNAYAIGFNHQRNALWTASFSLPLDDAKSTHVKPKYFVELFDHERRLGMYVVNPKHTVRNESTNEITYECEHVLSLLHSDVLFRYHQLSNYTTKDVLTYLLSQQEVAHWQLGTVGFTRYFHYAWENEESLLNAIMSVAQPFDVPFMWTWDDATYPFTLNLVSPSDEVKGAIISGKNIRGIEITEDPTEIVTRIYPLGFGEGVNQLTIAKVNGGQLYLRNAAAEAEYGVHKRVWVDARFEDATSLMASTQAILDDNSTPKRTVAIDCIDYSLIDPYELSQYVVGDVLRVYDPETELDETIRLERMEKGDIYGVPEDLQIELGSVRDNFGGTFADLEKKQLVNDTYSQGSTNIDSRDFSDNADANFPAVIRFPIPDDVVNLNQMLLTFETLPFRAYEKSIKGGGASTQTSSSGGGVAKSTASGGGSTLTSASGGGYSSSSAEVEFSGENLRTGLPYGSTLPPYEFHDHLVPILPGQLKHAHAFQIPNHNHSVQVPAHTHTFDIADHAHDINIPSHVHGIEYGIFEAPNVASAVVIKVDGTTIPVTTTSGEGIDLIPYLLKDSDGRISRGRYAEIKITPNDLARINATVISRLFIQSRIGGNY